jgi:hypothetical protein
MDRWQKLEVASKVVAAVLIPLTVAYLGNQVASANKQRDSETKFVELATAILGKEPGSNQTPESKNLRKWAVEVINRFSGIPMSEATAEALIENTALPQVSLAPAAPVEASDPGGTWGLVFGGDTTLESAKLEVTKTAERMGIGQGEVFRRSGSYRSVKVFVSRADAEDALGKARAVRPSSYVVNMSTWCPTSEQKSGYFECRAP